MKRKLKDTSVKPRWNIITKEEKTCSIMRNSLQVLKKLIGYHVPETQFKSMVKTIKKVNQGELSPVIKRIMNHLECLTYRKKKVSCKEVKSPVSSTYSLKIHWPNDIDDILIQVCSNIADKF